MTPFLPPLDSRWRLTLDYATDDAFRNGDNDQTMTGDTWTTLWNAACKAIGGAPAYNAAEYDDWSKRFDAFKEERRAAYGFDGIIPAGTIIQIERYHVSRSGENVITVKVLLSPSKFLTPKKHKGVMRGPGRLYFSLDQFNLLGELQEFTDDLA